MQIVKKYTIENVEQVVGNQREVGYLKNGILHLNNGRTVEAPKDAYLTIQPNDDDTIYASSRPECLFYRLRGDSFVKVVDHKAGHFDVIDARRVILFNRLENEETFRLFNDGKKIWTRPAESWVFKSNNNTAITCPDIKNKSLDFRDIDTFKVKKTLFAREGYRFVRNSHYSLGNNVIFIQKEKTPPRTESGLIVTVCDFDSGDVIWEAEYRGSAFFNFNPDDNKFYSFTSIHEEQDRKYVPHIQILDLNEQCISLEENVLNVRMLTSVNMSRIYKNIYFLADSIFDGGAIWLYDIHSRKVINHFELRLAKRYDLAAPVILNNELFQLDRGKTLHVFDLVFD